MKLLASDALGLVLSYLRSCGFKKAADYIKKKADYNDEEDENPLSKVSLMKMVKEYLIAHPEIRKSIKKYKKPVIEKPVVEEAPEEAEEEAEAAEEAPADENSGNEEEKVEEDMADEAPEVPEENPESEVVEESPPTVASKANGVMSEKSGPFKRFDTKILEKLPDHLRDNSFQAKFRYGSGDYYGIEGHQKLQDKAGKGFRKEKSKFKNKNFQGGKAGRIVYNVNSTKF